MSSNTVVVSYNTSFAIDNSMFVVDGSYHEGYVYDEDIFFMLGLEIHKDYCFVGASSEVNCIWDYVLDAGLYSNVEFKKSSIDLFIDRYISINGHPDLGLSEEDLQDIDPESYQDLLYDWYRDTYSNLGDTDGDPISLI